VHKTLVGDGERLSLPHFAADRGRRLLDIFRFPRTQAFDKLGQAVPIGQRRQVFV
jgi:hypothetical protein